LTQIQAGNAPDLATTTAGSASAFSVYALGSQGKLLDLTKGSPWIKRQPPAIRKYLEIKHHIYSMFTEVTPIGFVYNVDMFKSLGLTQPKTFADLLALCKKVSAAGKVPIALDMAAPTITGPTDMMLNLMDEFIYNKDPDWTLHRIQKKTTFASSPLWQRAFQAIQEMRDAGCFEPEPAAVSASAHYAMVANQQALGMIATSGEMTIVQALNSSIQLNEIPIPSDNARDTVVALGGSQNALVAFASTKYPKEAHEFINFVARPAQLSLKAKVQGDISTFDLTKGEVPATFADMVPLMKAGKFIISQQYGWPAPQKGLWNPGLLSQIPGLFTGQKTAQQILQTEDGLWDSK
jgi:raffinose/stachyose/melibiose transport system substrate-binding protein